MEDDDLFIGHESITDTNEEKIDEGKLFVYNLHYQLKKQIRNCENYQRMTPCVSEYFEKKYGMNYTAKHIKGCIFKMPHPCTFINELYVKIYICYCFIKHLIWLMIY